MPNPVNSSSTSAAKQPPRCYHCGDDCQDTSICIEEKFFCCHGCKMVYEILAENDLCNYYALEEMPGIQLKNRDFGDKFAFLDNEEIAQKLLQFSSESLQKVTLFLPAVHCSSCIWLLENLYQLREGITYSRINFVRKEITLTFVPTQISFREIAELLTTLGYEPQISLEDYQAKAQQKSNKALFYKIGITGFCFGNIMLLSFPDYLAVEDWVEESYKYFFGYLNILLALPVFFYSSSEYFRSAFKALRAGTINLDVPISLGILALFGRSLYEILSMTGAGYMDSLAGLLFFLLVGKWFQSKTYESLSFERDYQSYFPLAVKTRKKPESREFATKAVTDLKKNDLISIRNQEIIPADSILVSDKAYIDYSFVTGESEPIEKTQGDYIYAGGRQIGCSIEMAVQKEVSQSYLTQLWNTEIFQKNYISDEKANLDILSKYFTYITLGIAFAAAIFWYFVNPALLWNAFTAVLIVACPCALALATPYTLGNTMRIFGKNHFYLKNSDVVEKLARIQHLVFDKTGTITQGEEAEIYFEGKQLTIQEKGYIKSLVTHSTHPLSKKIAAFLQDSELFPITSFKEQEGKGIEGKITGNRVKIGALAFMDVSDSKSAFVTSLQLQSRVFVQLDEQLLGFFAIQNKYRGGFKELLEILQTQYDTSLITGDNEAEKKRLREYFGKHSLLKFHQKPEDKLAFIHELQQGQKILMLGDGLNDAGALKQSDVGIAITEDTTSFSPACDAILATKSFTRLADFLAFSKASLRVVRWSLILSLLYNLFGVSFAVTGQLSPVLAAILMPLSSVTVVAFVVGMTNWMAKKRALL